MIYYKKRSLIKKVINPLIQSARDFRPPCLPSFLLSFNGILLFCLIFLSFLYASYLFLLPVFVDEGKVENAINNFVLKNSKLTFDSKNFTIKSGYKFDINLKADYIKLYYPNKEEFVTIEKPDIDINALSLVKGYIDLNKIKTKKISVNTTFTSKGRYNSFEYFDIDFKNKNEKFKIRNFNLLSDEFLLNLYDENIKKKFSAKTSKLKVSMGEFKKPLIIKTSGVISGSNLKISDFNLNLSIKRNPNSAGKFKTKLKNLNYNPIRYALEYKFYSKTDINLKINPDDKKQNVLGVVNLKDYSFDAKGLKLPKNNLSLLFRGNSVLCDADFKFLKNQHIKIKSNASLSKNKFIEARLNSDEINLSDLNETLCALSKIFNLKIKTDDFSLSGILNLDLYLKSNFKTLNSYGKASIKNAKIYHKKTKITLDKINSNISFANNTINIINMETFVNDAKFAVLGKIDSKANLDIKLSSDEIDIASVINFAKEIPVLNSALKTLNNCSFKSGYLKLNSLVKGSLENPKIISNSTLNNLRVYLKKQKSYVDVKKISISTNQEDMRLSANDINFEYDNKIGHISSLDFDVLKNDIKIKPFKLSYSGLLASLDGLVKNYKTSQAELVLNFDSEIKKNNPYIVINNCDSHAKGAIQIKENKLFIDSFFVFSANLKPVTAFGKILNFDSAPVLSDVKISISEKTNFLFPKMQNLKFAAKGNFVLNGKPKAPDISAKANLYDIALKDFNLYVGDILLLAKNSQFYINVIKGQIFDSVFDLAAKAKFENNLLVVDSASINSPYLNVQSAQKYLKKQNSSSKFNLEIKSIKGYIGALEAQDVILNSLAFDGSFKNNILNVSNFEAQALNGKISGSSKINLLNQKVDLELILKELNIRLLPKRIKEFSIAQSGKLSALINVSFLGYNLEDNLNTLEGYLKFNIDNGELAQFAKLERFLQAGNILSQSFLKLTLNSTLSAITKQNTGDFKTIEGTIKIKDSFANIQYIRTQGSNMSLYITGKYNLLAQHINAKVLGRIPNSIVSVMGGVGKFSFSHQIDKSGGAVSKTLLEKKLSTELPVDEINKIPKLAYSDSIADTREFVVFLNGVAKSISAVRDFKWIVHE